MNSLMWRLLFAQREKVEKTYRINNFYYLVRLTSSFFADKRIITASEQESTC